MTEKEVKYGCLSKTLQKFLSMTNDQKRRKVYGNKTTSKYYERIVKSVNGSFSDHLNVIMKLPDEHKQRIDFVGQYDKIITQAVSKKFIDQIPNRFLKETIDRLHFIQRDIPDGPMKIHTLNDINKTIDWFEDIKFRENKK